MNLLLQEKINELFYFLNYTISANSLQKIIIISFNINDLLRNAINNNCVFSLNEISHAKSNDKLFIKYDFYNHKKLNKDNVVFSFGVNEQKGLICNFEDILLHNLELQKIFNEVEKPIEHKTQMNLNLTEEERKAKNELVLPFVKTEEEKKQALNPYKIEDNEGEEDEEIGEDPDEDLDI